MDLRKPKMCVLKYDNELNDTQDCQMEQELSIDKFMKYDVSVTEQKLEENQILREEMHPVNMADHVTHKSSKNS